MCPNCLWTSVFDESTRRCLTCGLDEVDFYSDKRLNKEDGIYKVLLNNYNYIAIVQNGQLSWLMPDDLKPLNLNEVFMKISRGSGDWVLQKLVNAV